MFQNCVEVFQSYIVAGGPIMYVLLGLSVIALAVFFERLFFYRRAGERPMEIERAVGEALDRGDPAAAAERCAGRDTSLRRLLRSGLEHWDIVNWDLNTLLEQEIRREVYRWSSGLSVIALVVRMAPLLGLLGTVTGMVEIFESLPGATEAPMVALASGIYKALYTTVAGLCIAIPALFLHGYLQSRVDDMEEQLSRAADMLLRRHVRPGRAKS